MDWHSDWLFVLFKNEKILCKNIKVYYYYYLFFVAIYILDYIHTYIQGIGWLIYTYIYKYLSSIAAVIIQEENVKIKNKKKISLISRQKIIVMG